MARQCGPKAFEVLAASGELDGTFLMDLTVADALGASLRAAFAPVLDEPIPADILALLERFGTLEG